MAGPRTEGRIEVEALPPGFDHWQEMLYLILRAFAYMEGVIDPPSSALRMTPLSLREKSAAESVFVATADGRLVGCLFLADRGDHAYVGKLAVEPACQGRGIGRRLIAAAEAEARRQGKRSLELQTRVELTGNQTAFARLGFRETARTAHAGHDRPTSVTMRKEIGA